MMLSREKVQISPTKIETKIKFHFSDNVDAFHFEKMADPELEALRAKRLAELQQQQQGPMRGPANDQNSAEEQRQKQEEMRNAMLSSLLTQEARARLNTIALTKPEKGRMVEDILIQNARRGAFGGGKVRSAL